MERKGEERKEKERKGKEKKRKERKGTNQSISHTVSAVHSLLGRRGVPSQKGGRARKFTTGPKGKEGKGKDLINQSYSFCRAFPSGEGVACLPQKGRRTRNFTTGPTRKEMEGKERKGFNQSINQVVSAAPSLLGMEWRSFPSGGGAPETSQLDLLERKGKESKGKERIQLVNQSINQPYSFCCAFLSGEGAACLLPQKGRRARNFMTGLTRKERKGKETKGKEKRKGKERKRKERKGINQSINQSYRFWRAFPSGEGAPETS